MNLPDYIHPKAELEIVSILKKNGLKLALAESVTGGLISKKITDVPGCSQVFELGVCTYSANFKQKILLVKKDTLDEFSIVSPQVAKEMAMGVLLLSQADISLSITGSAGPTPQTPNDKVGVAFAAVATAKKILSHKIDYPLLQDNSNPYKTRQMIREYFCNAALSYMLAELKKL